MTIGTSSSAPEADLASTPVASGLWRAVVTMAATAKAAAVRMIAPTLCGSVIWSSTSTMPEGVHILDVGRGQGIGLGEKPLMHGVRREPRGDRIRPHQFRRDGKRDAFLGETPQRVLGRQQPPDLARRIGERRRDRVPAIEDDVGRRVTLPLTPHIGRTVTTAVGRTPGLPCGFPPGFPSGLL